MQPKTSVKLTHFRLQILTFYTPNKLQKKARETIMKGISRLFFSSSFHIIIIVLCCFLLLSCNVRRAISKGQMEEEHGQLQTTRIQQIASFH